VYIKIVDLIHFDSQIPSVCPQVAYGLAVLVECGREETRGLVLVY
jgi:hypothetical protein